MERQDVKFPYISMNLLSFLPSMSLAAYYKALLRKSCLLKAYPDLDASFPPKTNAYCEKLVDSTWNW